MVRMCLVLLLGVAGWGILPGQSPAVSNLPRLAKTIVFKVDPAHRATVSTHAIGVPEIEARLQLFKGTAVSAVFPLHTDPGGAVDVAGRPLIDLSLIYSFTYAADLSEEEVAKSLAELDAIAYAEPWYTHQLYYQPNDPRSDTTGGISGMWHLNQIKAREAWDIERNDTSVVIGVVDSGTEGNHPDLQDNVAFNHDDPIDGLDNDQDGFVDNYKGWDFGGNTIGAVGDNDPSVGNVHGLWVTGI
ncbi:MAG: hypothetical protein AAFV07_10545, partial [Bacteroidota bacterium]